MTNFRLKEISIEGFKKFSKKQIFVIDRPPGLYFIGGKNEVRPRLGSNGAGKSTVWDAVVWCLKGETLRKVEGNVLKSWNQPKNKPCRVSLSFDKTTEDSYVVTRTQGPNSLKISYNGGDEKIIKQDELDDIIPLDSDQIIYALIVGQFNSSFLDLTPTPRLNLFSSIMGLDFWEGCSDKASAKLKLLETDKVKISSEQVAANQRVEDWKTRLISLENNSNTFNESRKAETDKLTVEADNFLIQVTELEKEHNELSMQLAAEEKSATKIQQEIDHVTTKLETLKIRDIDPLEKQILVQQLQKNTATQGLAKWKSIEDKCPYCEQEVSKDFLKTEKTKIQKELVVLSKGTTSNQGALEQLTKERQGLSDKLDELSRKNRDNSSLISQLNKKLDLLEKTKSNVLMEIKVRRDQVEALNGQTNPYLEMLTKEGTGLEEAEAKALELNSNYDAIVANITGIQFWSKGFKELRLWVITDALEALQIEANNALAELGLEDWTLKFTIERETSKKGALSKGLYVLVNSPDIPPDTYIPFEVWCGGETQRLKIATIIGFNDLIKNYKGISFNTMTWDEPSMYLSDEGIDDLIKHLYESAKEHKQTIYWIDQRYLESNYFNKVIKIINTKEGSIIQE